MIKESKRSQYGEYGLEPKCITIHNTNDYSKSAKELFEYYDNECKTFLCCHYLVDHNDIVEVMPLDWKTYHTGKGKDYAYNNSIVIDICSNLDNALYLEGQNRAIELIKKLMKNYNISKSELYFHRDFNYTVYCPCNILDLYKTKKNFLEKFFK